MRTSKAVVEGSTHTGRAAGLEDRARDLEVTHTEFVCSQGARGEVNPAARRLEMTPDVHEPGPDHEPLPRSLHTKQEDVLAHGTSGHCRALVSGGRAQEHTEECRFRVEGELKSAFKLRPRGSDAPVTRAAKKDRFADGAGDQVVDSAGGRVAQELRGRRRDRHEYFKGDLTCPYGRQVPLGDTVAAVFEICRVYFYGEEKRDTFVELHGHVPADMRASHVGKLRKALNGPRPAAASWGDELRKGLASGGLIVQCCGGKCSE